MATRMGQKPNKVVANATSTHEYLVPPQGTSFEFREIWTRVVRDFPADHFRESDIDVLRMYCDSVVQRIEVSRQLSEESYVVETARGTAPNPLVGVQTQLAGIITSCARQLRIAPMQRLDSRQVPKPPTVAPAEPDEGGKKRVGLRLAGVA